MKKVFYEKVGRRYKPVYEYDNDLMDALPKGAHMILVYPGGRSTRYNVNIDYAPLIAASHVAEDALSKALVKAGELRMQRRDRERKLTEEERAAWDNLVRVFGDSAKQLEWPSAREVAEAGVKALIDEAEKLMKHESVKKSYEHFLLMAELTKETKNDNS